MRMFFYCELHVTFYVECRLFRSNQTNTNEDIDFSIITMYVYYCERPLNDIFACMLFALFYSDQW